MCDFEMEQGEHFISNVRASLRIFVGGGANTKIAKSRGEDYSNIISNGFV